jgi:RNA polymerase sigma-70 factor (ECF subfamily)
MSRIATLLEPQIPALRRYAFALTRDHTAADDLVQDTLERAISRWVLRAGDTELRSWLFAILHNLFIDGRRAHRRRPLHDALDDEAEQVGTPATQEAVLISRNMLAQFGALSEEHQAVLLLVGVEGLAYASVARVLGVPLGTVMSRLSRAREQFRRLVDGERAAVRSDLRRVK